MPEPAQHSFFHNAAPHSVELSLTSAGKVTFSVKVYDEDESAAAERACVIFDQLTTRYNRTPPAGAK